MAKEDILLFSCYGMRGEGKSYAEHLKEKDKEIERLNNIINELDNFIDYELGYHNEDFDNEYWEAYKLKNKLQELKGVDKE